MTYLDICFKYRPPELLKILFIFLKFHWHLIYSSHWKKNYGRRCKYMSDTGLQVVIIISTASPKCLHYYLNDKTSSFIYFYWKRLVIITCRIVLLSGNEKKILWSFTTFRGTRFLVFYWWRLLRGQVRRCLQLLEL